MEVEVLGQVSPVHDEAHVGGVGVGGVEGQPDGLVAGLRGYLHLHRLGVETLQLGAEQHRAGQQVHPAREIVGLKHPLTKESKVTYILSVFVLFVLPGQEQ